MDDLPHGSVPLAEKLRAEPVPAQPDTLAAAFDQVRRHLVETLAAPPNVDHKRFVVLMDGVLLGGDKLLRALHSFINDAGGVCTEILPATVLWEDENFGWPACFQPFAVPSPPELGDCGNRLWELLTSVSPQPSLFVFIEQLERFAIQDAEIQDQARREFLAPLMRAFYKFPVFVIAQARHLPEQSLDYLKGYPLASTTQPIPLTTWTPEEILVHHPQVEGLNEPLRSRVLDLASGSPGIAARLADRVRADGDLRNACDAVLRDLVQGYDDITKQWPDYRKELSRIVIERANQIDILSPPPGGMFNPDPLRRLMRLCIIEPNGTNYRVAAPFESLLRGAP